MLASCLWITTSVAAFAQSTARLIVDQWRVEDGLPQNTVTSLAQDERGYLWIATRKGLARFDGAQFAPVTRVGAMDIGNLRLTAVLPDGDGKLWVSTYGPASCVSPATRSRGTAPRRACRTTSSGTCIGIASAACGCRPRAGHASSTASGGKRRPCLPTWPRTA